MMNCSRAEGLFLTGPVGADVLQPPDAVAQPGGTGQGRHGEAQPCRLVGPGAGRGGAGLQAKVALLAPALAHRLGQVIDRSGNFGIAREQHIHAHEPAGAGRRRPVAGKARWRRPRDRASRSPRWRRPRHRPCRRRTRDGAVRVRTARTRPACRRSGTVQAGTAPPLPPAATAPPCRAAPAPPPTQAPPEVLPAEAQRPPARADCQRPRAPQYRPQPAPISRSWKATPNQTEYRTFGQTRDHSTRRRSRRLYIRGARRHTVREGGPGSMR